MSDIDGDCEQQIKVAFENGFNHTALTMYDAYVEHGSVCNVIRCTSARNGSLLVYGTYIVAACTGKDRITAQPVVSEIIRGDIRLKHNGVELNMLGEQVMSYIMVAICIVLY
jgi:hypothetical protein